MKSIKYLQASFFLSAFLFVSPVHALWYQVEVIVFNYLSPEFNGELWYENPGLPDRHNSIELIAELADSEELTTKMIPAENADSETTLKKKELVPYLQLPVNDFRLDGVQRILKLSRAYRPLLHVSWQQPGHSLENARAVHLQKFEEIKEITSAAFLEPEPDDLDALHNETVEEEQLYQVLDLIFDGTIRLRSSKFLHVDVDIAYFPEFLTNENKMNKQEDGLFVQQQADYVRLQESRKIRLNEIHYFDHPIFGVILRVSRLRN